MICIDKQIKEELDFIKGEVEYLENDKELQEDIKNKDPIVEAFQKNNFKRKVELYKESIGLYEEALISNGTERLNLVRKAVIAELKGTNEYDLSGIETSINTWPEELKEEFKNFKNIHKKGA